MHRKTALLSSMAVAAGLVLGCALVLPLAGSPQSDSGPALPDKMLFDKKLAGDKLILHAVDRLMYGPGPGDVEAVKQMGLEKWIDLQLHPERIPENKELEQRLDPLTTLRMSQPQIAATFARQAARSAAAAVQAGVANRLAVRRRQKAADQPAAAAPPPPAQPPKTPLTDLLPRDQLRVLRQGTPEQRMALLRSIPPDKLDSVIEALPPALRLQLAPAADADMRRKLVESNQPRQALLAELSQAKLYRAIYSNRQLEEQLADFWFNHFNVDFAKGADRLLVTGYERDAIRPHVLGKFRDLLEATATSPAMMFYLDNWKSVDPDSARLLARAKAKQAAGLNENYARELMELHTLGVNGGYTQKDIVEVARSFTGWTVVTPNLGGPFFFNARTHDRGSKVVLGVTIPAGGGQEDGEKVLDILARHPSTARFISKELAQRFVADDPPEALIDRMAKTFQDTDGDIRAVLTTMFGSKEFFSEGAYHAKVKTPFEMIVSAVRATGAKVDSAQPLANQLANSLGQPLYRKLEPTGYSNLNAEWVNSAALLARMNFALRLAQNQVPGVQVDQQRFPTDPAAAASRFLFTTGTPQTLSAIRKAVEDQTKKTPDDPAGPGLIAGLVIGSPDFQRR